VEVESRELNQIDEALVRFRDGIYGHCEICDKPIPLARLQAVPYATTCIDCARKQERMGLKSPTSGFGDSTHSPHAPR
jgi:DnaK suppressor protein